MKSLSTKPLIGVVDDDESVRCGTTSLLRSAGYAIESFGTAEQFLESGDHHRFACVVADIQMPGIGGIELANRLNHDEPRTPVILVTSRTEQEILADAAASRALCLLRKPFVADRLLQCVRSAIG